MNLLPHLVDIKAAVRGESFRLTPGGWPPKLDNCWATHLRDQDVMKDARDGISPLL